MDPKPVINVEEHIGKTVGRRKPPSDPLFVEHSNRVRTLAWMDSLPSRMPKRGVYRFKSHEEAELWMTKNTGPAKK